MDQAVFKLEVGKNKVRDMGGSCPKTKWTNAPIPMRFWWVKRARIWPGIPPSQRSPVPSISGTGKAGFRHGACGLMFAETLNS
jgi:hypothetical protein